MPIALARGRRVLACIGVALWITCPTIFAMTIDDRWRGVDAIAILLLTGGVSLAWLMCALATVLIHEVRGLAAGAAEDEISERRTHPGARNRISPTKLGQLHRLVSVDRVEA